MRGVSGSVNILFQDSFASLVSTLAVLAPVCSSEPPIIGGASENVNTSFPRFCRFALAAAYRPEPSSLLQGGRIMGGGNLFGKGVFEIISRTGTAAETEQGFRPPPAGPQPGNPLPRMELPMAFLTRKAISDRLQSMASEGTGQQIPPACSSTCWANRSNMKKAHR